MVELIIKEIILSFLNKNTYSHGRPKKYELLGFVIYGALNGKYSCRKLAKLD